MNLEKKVEKLRRNRWSVFTMTSSRHDTEAASDFSDYYWHIQPRLRDNPTLSREQQRLIDMFNLIQRHVVEGLTSKDSYIRTYTTLLVKYDNTTRYRIKLKRIKNGGLQSKGDEGKD